MRIIFFEMFTLIIEIFLKSSSSVSTFLSRVDYYRLKRFSDAFTGEDRKAIYHPST
jgi:abortive infection bacteriophage resistance protein